jgi:hypothetical protein
MAAHLLGCLALSLPRVRPSGAGADWGGACARGDRRAVSSGRHPSAGHLHLKRACLAGDAAAAYRELGIWARCKGLKTAQVLCAGEPALRCELARLERHLYGGTPAPWNGPALFHAAPTIRAARLAADRRGSHAALPALNPYDRATSAATRAAGSARCFSPPTNAPFYGRR